MDKLEVHFTVQKYLTADVREQLATMLHLTGTQVQNWFQSKRYENKKKQARLSQKSCKDLRTTHPWLAHLYLGTSSHRTLRWLQYPLLASVLHFLQPSPHSCTCLYTRQLLPSLPNLARENQHSSPLKLPLLRKHEAADGASQALTKELQRPQGLLIPDGYHLRYPISLMKPNFPSLSSFLYYPPSATAFPTFSPLGPNSLSSPYHLFPHSLPPTLKVPPSVLNSSSDVFHDSINFHSQKL